MRKPDRYKCLFTSQYPDNDGQVDDCGVSTSIHLVDMWTLGEAMDEPVGTRLSKEQRKRLRIRMRNRLPDAKQKGGLFVTDLAKMVAEEWEYLPPLPVRYDLPWSDLATQLANGFSAALVGNPSHVKDLGSPLRKWTKNDDFGHWITAIRASGDRIFIVDSLAPYEGTYDGQWVPSVDVRQFCHLTDGRVNSLALCKIGGASQETLAKKDAAEIISRLRTRIAELEEEAPPDQEEARLIKVIEKARANAESVKVAADNLDDLIGTLKTGLA